MPASGLQNARFVLVTGKGGAGKSLLAAAVAEGLAAKGKKVLLAELGHRDADGFSRLHEFFGESIFTHEARETLPNLWAARLDPVECLAEYVALKLPGGSLAGILLHNKVTRALLEVVPGLTDMVSLGKLWYEVKEEKNYDCIVLDAPASGHAVALARTPKNFARLTKRGPLYRDASAMQGFFASKQAITLLVTLPEAMSLEETEETRALLAEDFTNIAVIANKVLPAPAGGMIPQHVEAAYRAAVDYYTGRRTREQAALLEWQNGEGKLLAEIPYFFEISDAAKLRSQAKAAGSTAWK